MEDQEPKRHTLRRQIIRVISHFYRPSAYVLIFQHVIYDLTFVFSYNNFSGKHLYNLLTQFNYAGIV